MANDRAMTFLPDGGRYYTTTAPVVGRGYVVPAGFRFNVSVPKRLEWYVNPHDPVFLEAAAHHDYALHVLKWGRVKSIPPWDEQLAGRVPIPKRIIIIAALLVGGYSMDVASLVRRLAPNLAPQ